MRAHIINEMSEKNTNRKQGVALNYDFREALGSLLSVATQTRGTKIKDRLLDERIIDARAFRILPSCHNRWRADARHCR